MEHPRLDLAVLLTSQQPSLVREAYVVAQVARSRGFSARVLQVETALSDGQVISQMGGIDPRIIALGVSSSTIERSLGIAAAVETAFGGDVILFGEVFALDSGRGKVPPELSSGVVVGPAPQVVLDLLRTPDGPGQRSIAGLDRLDGSFRPRAPNSTIEGNEFPRFETGDIVQFRRVGLPIRLGFGCPRRCVFCGDQPSQGCYRTRSVQDVVEEMDFHLGHYGVKSFQFCDLVLNGDLDLLESFCDLLGRRHLDLVWWGRVMVEPRMTRSLYRKMRLCGCAGLEFEVISGSNGLLEAMGAGFTAEDAGEALCRATSAGVNTRVSLIVGLPGESELELGDTCDWLHEHRFRISAIGDLVPCELKEGSILFRHPSRFGICIPRQNGDRDWHDGGFNTSTHRLKRTRQLRVFIEDGLHLEVKGRTVDLPWDEEARELASRRMLACGQQDALTNDRFRRRHMALAGVIQRGVALCGPTDLEIDLTNNCNQRCAGCWNHSLLMRERRLRGEERGATLGFEALRDLIVSARQMGTRRVQLSGAGEPFMHPRIDDVLALIKEAGLEVNVVTNFTLVDEARARNLVDLGVDALTVSLWAGSSSGYSRTHPTARGDQLYRIVQVLRHLTDYRGRTGGRYPRIKIYNVISNLNCNELHAMIDLARDAGADWIEFTPIDIVEGYTDSLSLNETDRNLILDQLLGLRRRGDYLQRSLDEARQGRVPGYDEQGEFARFLQRDRPPQDFRFSLGDIRCWEAWCRRGIHCSRVYEEIQRSSAILFGFPASQCSRCMAVEDCGIDPVTLNVAAPYLSLQGFGSFWRRIQGRLDGACDARVVEKTPCAIGYIYARVQANGSVIPCCKATELPLGNIQDGRFEEIWWSDAYQEFRFKALTRPKSDAYFRSIDCYNVCDNLGHNMAVQARLDGLSTDQIAQLRQQHKT